MRNSNSIAEQANDFANHAQPMLTRLASQAEDLAQRSLDAVRGSAYNVRERAVHAGESATRYVQNEPIKSVLIAAVAGAAVIGVLSLIGYRRIRDR